MTLRTLVITPPPLSMIAALSLTAQVTEIVVSMRGVPKHEVIRRSRALLGAEPLTESDSLTCVAQFLLYRFPCRAVELVFACKSDTYEAEIAEYIQPDDSPLFSCQTSPRIDCLFLILI